MAATFFGEVVKAPCRAGTEDEEEEEDGRETPEDKEVRRQLMRKRECSCYIAEDQQYQWLEKVFGSCPKKNMQVTILTSRHITDYKTSESTCSLPSPFLRALKTQNFKDPVCCSLLEQPNIVHDLPAAVLSYCQVWRIPAVLYLCYTDVMKLDRVTVEAFTPVLSSRSLKGLVKNIPQSTEVLKKLMTTNEIQSNIYT